jgi:hypothetical protein
MKTRKLLIVAVLALGICLAANPGAAVVVTSIPDGTIYPMPGLNAFGPGPQTFGPGITWTSTNATYTPGSVFGYTGNYYFGLNGNWRGDLGPMAGLNDTTDTMTFTFSTPISAVGGFLNYYPGLSNPTTIVVYDASNNLIESYNLTFLTGGGDNTGAFYGFSEVTNNIKYFTLTNNYIGITDLTTAIVPLPGAVWLLGSGLVGLAGLRSKFKS